MEVNGKKAFSDNESVVSKKKKIIVSGTDINAQYQNKKEAQSDNRLGGSSTAYRKNYKPKF